MKRFLFSLLVLTLALGCTSQEAHLIYLPETTPTPAPLYTPAPTPVPEPIVVPPIEGEGFPLDANGIPILDPQNHYYQFYMSVDDLRVYEENGETMIDAVITNNYPRALSGGLRITFYKDGIKYGYGDFYSDGEGLKLFSGRNRVYADVHTEVNVLLMDFEITVSAPFAEIVTNTPAPETTAGP